MSQELAQPGQHQMDQPPAQALPALVLPELVSSVQDRQMDYQYSQQGLPVLGSQEPLQTDRSQEPELASRLALRQVLLPGAGSLVSRSLGYPSRRMGRSLGAAKGHQGLARGSWASLRPEHRRQRVRRMDRPPRELECRRREQHLGPCRLVQALPVASRVRHQMDRPPQVLLGQELLVQV